MGRTSSETDGDARRVKLGLAAWREQFQRQFATWTLASNELKPALLLTGPDLVAAEGWLLAPEAKLTQTERQFIAKSVMQASVRRTRNKDLLDAELAENVQRRLRLIFAMSIVILAIMAPGLFNYMMMRQLYEQAEAERVATRLEVEPPLPATSAANRVDMEWRRQEQTRLAAEANAELERVRLRRLPDVAQRLVREGQSRPGLLIAIEALDRVQADPKLDGKPESPIAKAAPTAITPNATVTRAGRTAPQPLKPATAPAAAPTLQVAAGMALFQAMATSRDLESKSAWGAANAVVSMCGAGQTVIASLAPKSVQVWDLASGAERLSLGKRPERLQAVSFDRACGQIVLASAEHYAEVWSLGTGQRIAELKGHEADVITSAFSPDGRTIATGAQEGSARLWAARTGKLTARLSGHDDVIQTIGFSGDGRLVVTGSRDKTARVWDTATGRSVVVLEGHQGAVTSAAFSTDAERVLTTSWDGYAAIWSIATAKRLATIRVDGTAILTASFSPDGKSVGTLTAGTSAYLWDAETGDRRVELSGHSGALKSLVFTPDSRLLATLSWAGEARLWNAKTGQLVTVLTAAESPIQAVSFSADGQTAVALDNDGRVSSWPAFESMADALAHAKSIAPACLSTDERRTHDLTGDVPAWCALPRQRSSALDETRPRN